MPSGIYLRTEKHKLKISLAKKGKTSWNKGIKMSEKTKEKLRKINKGKILTFEHIQKIKKSNKGKHSGEKSNFWKGGIAYLPYSIDWTETLRTSIRERDKFVCQICNKKQGNRLHSVHHIDYDKKNCNPNNLITLCISCHMKTNTNREKWFNYFKNKIIC